MQSAREDSSWEEYKRLVLSQLEGLHKAVGDLTARVDHFHSEERRLRNDEITSLKVDVATLKVKLAMIAVGGGVGSSVATSVIMNLLTK